MEKSKGCEVGFAGAGPMAEAGAAITAHAAMIGARSHAAHANGAGNGCPEAAQRRRKNGMGGRGRSQRPSTAGLHPVSRTARQNLQLLFHFFWRGHRRGRQPGRGVVPLPPGARAQERRAARVRRTRCAPSNACGSGSARGSRQPAPPRRGRCRPADRRRKCAGRRSLVRTATGQAGSAPARPPSG